MKQYIFLVATPVYNVQPYLLLYVSILACCCAVLTFYAEYSMMSKRFIERNKIPEDSFWQKLYPFKYKPVLGLLYIRFIPLLLSFLILFAVLIVYVIYWIKPELVSEFLYSQITVYVSGAYLFIWIIALSLK